SVKVQSRNMFSKLDVISHAQAIREVAKGGFNICWVRRKAVSNCLVESILGVSMRAIALFTCLVLLGFGSLSAQDSSPKLPAVTVPNTEIFTLTAKTNGHDY